MSRIAIALALGGMLAVAGCDANALQNAAGALTSPGPSSTASKVKVNGMVFASADQVAVISTGGLNHRVLARADEKGVKAATVKLTELGGSASATAQTSDTGAFSMEVPAGKTYVADVKFTGKNDVAVTLTGLVVVGSAAADLQLDVAHNLVASKLVKGGVKKVESAKLAEAVSKMSADLETEAKAPAPASRDEAASKFDALAKGETKTLVEGMLK